MYFFLQARSVIMHAFQSLIFVQKKKKDFCLKCLKKVVEHRHLMESTIYNVSDIINNS